MRTLLAFRHLYPALQEHRRVEDETRRLLEGHLEERFRAPALRRAGVLRYARRHFFSGLFLAIYRTLGIPAERRLFYGLINHAIRGIVTGTDNLLDDEYKEMLPLAFPERATRFKSVMHILLFDRILFQVLDQATARGTIGASEKEAISRALFNALVPIGAEEASEEGGVATIFTPARILDEVHRFKGGNLLRLAFIAPLMAERDRPDRLRAADQAVFSIGMALQVIDDLTDFHPDLAERRHNYLVSSIFHEGDPGERARLASLLEDRPATGPGVETVFAASSRRVLERAIGEALHGFERLDAIGFWLNRASALDLIRYLFHLRGVGHLLRLLPPDNRFTSDLSIDHAA